MAFYKTPSNIKTSILNFVKNLLSKQMTKDIDTILSPCCVPTIVFGTDSCSSDDTANGVLFSDVTITATSLANQTCTLILADVDMGGGAITTITFDNVGVWEGDIQTSWWNSDGEQTLYIILIPENSRVLHKSVPFEVTGINNCN